MSAMTADELRYMKTRLENITMSGIFNLPVANTMAFGGVATGIMKANEQQTAAGIMR